MVAMVLCLPLDLQRLVCQWRPSTRAHLTRPPVHPRRSALLRARRGHRLAPWVRLGKVDNWIVMWMACEVRSDVVLAIGLGRMVCELGQWPARYMPLFVW
jgi:hypothetical protein